MSKRYFTNCRKYINILMQVIFYKKKYSLIQYILSAFSSGYFYCRKKVIRVFLHYKLVFMGMGIYVAN